MKALAALALLALISPPALAGNLTPPPGPPVPTMKTLAEVEPRTPITQADIPLTIAEPGSYYFAQNLDAPSGVALTIAAAGVTLDLRGFSITGNPAAAAIRISAGADHARISGGRITGAQFGVFAEGRDGRAEDLVIDAADAFGAPDAGGVRPGPSWLVARCEIREYAGAGAAGVYAATSSPASGGARIVDCEFINCAAGVRSNAAPILVKDSAFRSCTEAVVFFGSLKDGFVTDCIALNCPTGFVDNGQPGENLFTRNQALGCPTPYVNVPNVVPAIGSTGSPSSNTTH